MIELSHRLHTAFGDLAERAPHDPSLAETIRRQARERRRRTVAPLAAVGAVAVILVAVGLIAARGPAATGGGLQTSVPPSVSTVGLDPDASASDRPLTGTGCRPLTTAVLPVWARAGFTPPYTATFATSSSGDLLAVLFGPLAAPPAASGPTNKVLWISRATAPPAGQPQVQITAHLDGTDRTARVSLPDGFGPSTVDLPAPGCWHLHLESGNGGEDLDLSYANGSSPSRTS